jgi:hypothetical protein
MTYQEYQAFGAMADWPKCVWCKRRFDSALAVCPPLFRPYASFGCPVYGCAQKSNKVWLQYIILYK